MMNFGDRVVAPRLFPWLSALSFLHLFFAARLSSAAVEEAEDAAVVDCFVACYADETESH